MPMMIAESALAVLVPEAEVLAASYRAKATAAP
jgi:hypothetical protein